MEFCSLFCEKVLIRKTKYLLYLGSENIPQLVLDSMTLRTDRGLVNLTVYKAVQKPVISDEASRQFANNSVLLTVLSAITLFGNIFIHIKVLFLNKNHRLEFFSLQKHPVKMLLLKDKF